MEADIWEKGELEFRTNTRVYVTDSERPETYRTGCVARTMRLVLSDLESAFSRGNQFALTLAEAHFYYLANFYYAWEQISIVRQRKPTLFMKQRIYNFARILFCGIEGDEDKDLERTCDSIDYLRYYNNFIEQIEDSTEFTLKFWVSLLDERPSAQRLNNLGKALFESKYKIVKIIQEISKITSNHIDFLIRYGLFMKYVMHDQASADQAFSKMVSLQENSRFSSARSHKFSIFGGDLPVLLMVCSVSSSGATTICEANVELERRLGYSREELIGCPATNLMPTTIAQYHDKFVQAFFRSMDAHSLSIPRLRFIKKGDGTYLPCDTLVKLIPRLNEGIMVASFFIPDPAVSKYTSYKSDMTVRKVRDNAIIT